MTDETIPTEVHRVTLLVVDHDRIGGAAVGRVIENANYPNDCVSPKAITVETRRVDWHDGHPLNQRDGWRAAYDALFPAAISVPHGDVTREMIERATPEELLAGPRHVAPPPSERALAAIANGLRTPVGADPAELANLRAIAGALYAKLLQTARRLGQHENTAALEVDLATVHVELGKLGVV